MMRLKRDAAETKRGFDGGRISGIFGLIPNKLGW